MVNAGDLRCRMTVCRRVKKTNELNETYYDYEPERKFWARIVPTGGRTQEVPGEMERAEVTHRMEARRSIFPYLSTDLRLEYLGQRYEIITFYPNYKRSGFIDIFCRLVVEDGIKSF